LEPPLSGASELPRGQVRVQAGQVRLEQVQSSDVQLIADASGVTEAGQVEVPVRPQVPEGLVVLRYSPTTLSLTIEGTEP
jgi:hypothetical protein